jgi:cardiolipin synthase
VHRLPNLLTVVRLILIPFVVRSLLKGSYQLALGAFFTAGLTDAVDGWLARRFGWTSRFGAYMDPVADKGLLVSVWVTLAVIGAAPVWLTALVLGRDLLILLFAAFALAFTRLRAFPPSVWGKLSTFLQIGAAVWVMVSLAFPSWGVGRALPGVFAVVAAGTVWSGAHYVWRGVAMLRGDGSTLASR